MAPRRDPLEILLAEKARADARLEALTKKANPLDQAIQIAKEKQLAEENGFLGNVVRGLLDDDVQLRLRMAVQAAKLYPDDPKQKHKKGRAVLKRVLGPLPSPAPVEPLRKTDDEVVREFVPVRPGGFVV